MDPIRHDYNIVRSVQRFYCKYHCFPRYVKVHDVVVERDEIIETIERYLDGRPFQWFRRSKFNGQTKDALVRIKTQLLM